MKYILFEIKPPLIPTTFKNLIVLSNFNILPVESEKRETVRPKDWLECSDDGHGLRTPRKGIYLTARPKVQSQFQIFRYGQSIFCLPHQPNFSDIFDLCLHCVSVVRDDGHEKGLNYSETRQTK